MKRTQTIERMNQQQLPLRWRAALAFMFTGGAFVVFGALITLVYMETTPVTYVAHIHKGNIQSVAKAPNHN